jgi:hypothetical protein
MTSCKRPLSDLTACRCCSLRVFLSDLHMRIGRTLDCVFGIRCQMIAYNIIIERERSVKIKHTLLTYEPTLVSVFRIVASEKCIYISKRIKNKLP